MSAPSWDDPAARAAARYSLADFSVSFTDDPLEIDPEFTRWRALTARAGGHYQQAIDGPPEPRGRLIDGDARRAVINLSAYNYLGLARHPHVVAAARDALERYGVGACGSPMISGRTGLHAELERRLSALLGRERTMLFNSGYGGVLGVTAGLLRKGDVAVVDARIHLSVIDGVRLSGARLRFFEHNDPASLDRALAESAGSRRLVIVEGIYSLDGDMADLPRLAPVCRAHGVGLVVDEAHSVLTCGATGGGVTEQLGMQGEVALYYGTFSKAFAGMGGFVSGPAETIDYLCHYADSYGFSCALPAALVAAHLAVLDVVEREPELMQRLADNAAHLRAGLAARGIGIGASTTHVVPLVVGGDRARLYRLADGLRARGLFLVPFDYPSVPADELRFRACVTAAHTRADLDEALAIIGEVFGAHDAIARPSIDRMGVGRGGADAIGEVDVIRGAVAGDGVGSAGES